MFVVECAHTHSQMFECLYKWTLKTPQVQGQLTFFLLPSLFIWLRPTDRPPASTCVHPFVCTCVNMIFFVDLVAHAHNNNEIKATNDHRACSCGLLSQKLFTISAVKKVLGGDAGVDSTHVHFYVHIYVCLHVCSKWCFIQSAVVWWSELMPLSVWLSACLSFCLSVYSFGQQLGSSGSSNLGTHLKRLRVISARRNAA